MLPFLHVVGGREITGDSQAISVVCDGLSFIASFCCASDSCRTLHGSCLSKYGPTEMRLILCKSSEAGPRQGQAEQLRSSRNKIHKT